MSYRLVLFDENEGRALELTEALKGYRRIGDVELELLSDVEEMERRLALYEGLDGALLSLDSQYDHPFIVSSHGRDYLVDPKSLHYIESNKRILTLYSESRSVELYARLTDFLRALPPNFVHCHKSFVVNMDYILELGRGEIILRTGELITVSQRRYKQVRESFAKHIGRSFGADLA